MQVNILRSKILRAEVTDTQQDYEGSLAIDSAFMEMVDLLPYEKILVGNITTGDRFETYAIPAPTGSRTFSLNGAAAHRGTKGDRIVVMSFAQMAEADARRWQPRVLVLGESNGRVVRRDHCLPEPAVV